MTILKGDCIEVLKAIKPNSVDAVVTDPPYGLEFMGKEWDKFKEDKRNHPLNVKNQRRMKRLESGHITGYGFPKKNPRCKVCDKLKWGREISICHCNEPDFDFRLAEYPQKYQLWHTQWLTEAYRVLKPGGSMLVMGGTRTFHRLMVAIEDTGFIIKDTLAFMYGSGFPKAQALSTGLTDRFLQASLQGAFHWKNKTLNSQSDYQEDRHLCGEQFQSSLTALLNADSIKVDVPKHNHLSLREFSIHQDNGHKYKVSSFDVFFPHATQDCSPLAFALPKDAFAQVSRLNEIVPILIDDKIPSSKLLLDALHEWHNDIYLNNNEPFPDEAKPLALKIIYHNDHILIESYHNHDDKYASFFEQLKNRVAQKFSHKYRILLVQKDPPFCCISDGMSPVAYIHFSKSCKGCQAKIYQALIDYDGYKCGGLKPAWEPIVYAYKPVEKSIVDNVLKWGVGAVNVAECRVGKQSGDRTEYGVNGIIRKGGNVYGKQGGEIQFDGTKGRFPANVILSHHPECEQVGVKRVKGSGTSKKFHGGYEGKSVIPFIRGVSHPNNQHADKDGLETVESWDCHPDCAIRVMDEQSGDKAGAFAPVKRAKRSNAVYGEYEYFGDEGKTFRNDSGGASRFFYCAKASRGERNRGLEGMEEKFSATMGNGIGKREHNSNESRAWVKNNHPTVKPIALFEWLIKLVTREGQIILDPFLGSGTTAIAAHKAGRECVGIEREDEYMEIAKRRIDYWESQPQQQELRA